MVTTQLQLTDEQADALAKIAAEEGVSVQNVIQAMIDRFVDAKRDRIKGNLLSEHLQAQREVILGIARQHGASNVRVFGSVARGEATATSDVDFLVDIEPGRSLFDRIALIQDLEDALGIRVDVVTERGLRPAIRDEVLSQAQPL
jgi:predicted nucleotidyltransferase